MKKLSILGTIAFAALVTLVAGLDFGNSGALVQSADAMELEREVVSLRVTVVTGDDDLRSESDAVAELDYESVSGNDLTASANLNNNASWGNGSTHSKTFALPGGVTLGSLEEFHLVFHSGQSGPFDTGDNWNIDGLTVVGILEDGSEIILVQRAATRLHRFKSDIDTRYTVQL
ncbi:hypothetical protein [Haliangium ochraceum]|uniref:Uncharacterized protein n=1 Tax=Haliangium ochraceum (strain DSM 14365 / JCM 11303 / SMP-2) TaxID=502025 RepID=D0LIG6_HALO1|nr:hypothetical protein [Haliangium ochraceum]ACY18322.1 hypothetical protein Hoch_5846 [Haliangium ochraceum DSM 14365]